jgi:hypothetical protein
MYEATVVITGLFLVSALVFAELFVRSRGIKGTLVKVEDDGMFSMGISLRARVAMPDGSEVDADLPGCTACMERLVKGDMVRMLKTREGYRIASRALPLKSSLMIKSKTCSCGESITRHGN